MSCTFNRVHVLSCVAKCIIFCHIYVSVFQCTAMFVSNPIYVLSCQCTPILCLCVSLCLWYTMPLFHSVYDLPCQRTCLCSTVSMSHCAYVPLCLWHTASIVYAVYIPLCLWHTASIFYAVYVPLLCSTVSTVLRAQCSTMYMFCRVQRGSMFHCVHIPPEYKEAKCSTVSMF